MNVKVYSLMALSLMLVACGGGNKDKKQTSKTKEPQTIEVQQTCRATTDDEIASLFDRWNSSLKTGKAKNVVANYADNSILLPTVSNKVRYSPAEKEDYFNHFLEKAPVGEINERFIQIGCNTALDAGIYTFNYGKTGEKATGRYSFTYKWDGKQWLITSHHSSLMPEQASKAPQKPAH